MPNYNQPTLESLAAEYFLRLRTSPETWNSIDDVEPQLSEFQHRMSAGDCRSACQALEDIASHLLSWGYLQALIEMRTQLVERLADETCSQPVSSSAEVANQGGLGLAYLFVGRPKKASEYLKIARKRSKANGQEDPDLISWREQESTWCGYLGWSKAYQGDIASGRQDLEEALKIAKGVRNERKRANWQEALWQNEIGWLKLDYYYDTKGAFDDFCSGVEKFEEWNKQQEDGDPREQISIRPNWGLAYADLARASGKLGQWDDARKNFSKALEIFSGFRHGRWGRGLLPGNIASFLRDRGFAQKADRIYRLALESQREIGNRRGEQITLARLGNASRDLGWDSFLADDCAAAAMHFQSAINFYDRAASLAERGNDHKRRATSLRRLGNVHRELSRVYSCLDKRVERKNSLELAETYHRSAHETAPKGYIKDERSGDGLWEDYYHWLECTRLVLEQDAPAAEFPKPPKALLDATRKDALAVAWPPELLMGIVLLRESEAYGAAAYGLTNAKKAFKAAADYCRKGLKEAGSNDRHRTIELRYAQATALVGLAICQGERERKKLADRALAEFQSLVQERHFPSLLRDSVTALLMMQDAFQEPSHDQELIQSVLEGIKGQASRRPSLDRHDEHLFDACLAIFE